MNISLKFVVLLFVLFQSYSVSSEAKNSTNYYLAIKGGVSLGSYETGINRTILKYIENKNLTNKNFAKLIAFSGASAGSINSVLSVVDACIEDKTLGEFNIYKEKEEKEEKKIKVTIDDIDDTLDSNFMRVAWDVGINDLVPTDKDENNYKSLYKSKGGKNEEGVGVFSRDAFEDKKEIIKRLIDKKGKSGCNLTVTMSITMFKPYKYNIDKIGAEVQLQRFVVPLDAFVDNKKKLRFKNSSLSVFKEKGDEFNIPSIYLRLVEDKDRHVKFDDVWKLTMASSSFPIAFHPVELSFCFSHELRFKNNNETKYASCSDGKVQTAKFSDGGLFDNSPIGVVWDIAKSTEQNFKNTKVIYINPDSYRSKNAKNKFVEDKHNVGLSEYMGYFSSSFLTAHEAEYKTSLEQIVRDTSLSKIVRDKSINDILDNKDLGEKNKIKKLISVLKEKPAKYKRIFYMTNRYHNLLADLHAHFGAFYAKEYRMHDYLVGVYDGFNITAQLDCDEINNDIYINKFSNEYKYCVRDAVSQTIERMDGSNDSINFLRYLYNSEYTKSLSYLKSKKNEEESIYIILSKSFGVVNKDSQNPIEYSKYLLNLNGYIGERDIEKKYPDLYTISTGGRTYTSRKISKMYENLIQMQELSAKCKSCNGKELNILLGGVLKTAETVVDPILSHHETKVWPKPIKEYVGLSYGYNLNQKNQVYGVDIRPQINFLSEKKLSLDFGVSYHDYGEKFKNDDYWSYSIGLLKHNDTIYFPTWGLGYQYETKGDHVYGDSLNSIFLKASFLNELFTVKYLHRLDKVKKYPVITRDDNAVILSVDGSRIIQMLFH